MEINIDVSKIVAETLKNYPSCAHLQRKVEAIYKEHYEELKISVTESNRLGGLDEMIISYETPFLKDRDNFLKKDWKRLNLTQYQTLDEEKFEREVRIQYFQQVVIELKALQEFQRRSAKPIIKDNYCCRYTRQIMQDLVSRYNVSQSDVRFFENFFVQHLYTNLDLGNVYRDKTTEDLDFEKLISQIFEVASLFEKDVQEYFFTCIEEDAERENKLRFGETDWHILRRKIEERRKVTASTVPKAGRQPAPVRTFQSLFKDLPTMERLLAAALSVGLIAKNGEKYAWIEEGAKSHRVCALWFTAVDAGMIKARLKNNEATTKAIQEFFGMDSLSKDTIDNVNQYNDEYNSTKSALEKKLKK